MKKRAELNVEERNSNEEARAKLLKEIQTLKQAIRRLDGEIGLCKFADACQLEVPLEPAENAKEALAKVRNVDVELERELYMLAGMHCVRFEETFTFQFSTGRRITKDRQYAVQILNDNGRGKLGKWVLPMSLDIKEILSEHPLDDFSNVKPFLKNCKHHVECYACREEQYNELKNFLVDTLNCRLDTNFGYTRVTIEFLKLRENRSESTYNVTLNLFYKSNEATPYKIASELMEDDELPEVLLKKLDKYFKPFLKLDLKSGFEKTIKAQTTFSWTREMRIEDIIETEANFEEHMIDTSTKPRKRKRANNEDDTIEENGLTNVDANNLTDYLDENSQNVAETSDNREENNAPEVEKQNSKEIKAPSKGKGGKNKAVKRRKTKK